MDFVKPNYSQRLQQQQQQQQHPKVEMAAMRQVIGFNPITTDMRPKLHRGGGQECRQSPSSSSSPPPSWSSGRGSTSPRSALQGLLLSSSAMDPPPLINHEPPATGGQSTNNGGLRWSTHGLDAAHHECIPGSDQCPSGGESKDQTKGVMMMMNGAGHSSCNSSMMMIHGAIGPSTTSSNPGVITNGAAIHHPIISKSPRLIDGADLYLLPKSSEVPINGAQGVMINGANDHPIISSSYGVNNRNGANRAMLSNNNIQVQMERSNYAHSLTSNINSHSATLGSSCNTSHGRFQEAATRQATMTLKGHNPTMSSDNQSMARRDRISGSKNGGKLEPCTITASDDHLKLREIKEDHTKLRDQIKEPHQYGMVKFGLQVLHRSTRARAGGFNSEGMAAELMATKLERSETRTPPYPIYKSNNIITNGSSRSSSSKRGSGRSLFVLVSSSDDYSNGDDCYYSYHDDDDDDRDQLDYCSSNHRSSPSLSMDFLKRCHLCRRHLAPGYDIFMYNGDKAFCSMECRYQQIVTDEKRENCPPLIMRASSNIPISTIATLYSHPSTAKPSHYNQRNLLNNNTMAVA